MKNKFLYMWKLPFLWGMGNRLIQIKERANIPLIIYVTWNCTKPSYLGTLAMKSFP